MPRSSLAVATALLFVACGHPAEAIDDQVMDDGWRTVPGTELELRLGKKRALSLVSADGGVLAEGAGVVGSRLPFEHRGVRCALVVTNVVDDTSTAVRPSLDREQVKPRTGDLVTVHLTGLSVRLEGEGAPFPDSEAASPGAQSRLAIGWLLPLLLLGWLSGFLMKSENGAGRILLGLGVVVAALGLAAFVAFTRTGASYAVSHLLLFSAVVAVGHLAFRGYDTTGWRTAIPVIGGATVGIVGTALLTPVWSPGGPLLALGIGAALVVAAFIVAEVTGS